MTRQEMLRELAEARICPVMVYTENDVEYVPLFPSDRVALEFAKRNTPKDYSIGTMAVDEDDIAALKAAGLTTIELGWPNKRRCTVHVLELSKETETHARGYRNNT